MSDEQLVATNEELVKRLRGMDGDSMSIKTLDEAADRIDELEVSLQAVLNREAATTARYDAKTDELEAKLAKAVEALQAFKAFDEMPTRYKRPDVFEVSVRRKLLSTLAEIENSEAVTLGEKT
jgi:hypothetical protein